MIERAAYFHHILIFYSPSCWKLSGRWMNAYEIRPQDTVYSTTDWLL